VSPSRQRGSKSPRIVLSPEQLEDRTNPAGNVTAIMDGGVLHIWGDGQDNRIWVASGGDDTAVIVTLDGTTLNGARVPLWFDGVKFAYDIQLHDGNDFLYVSGLTGTAGLFVQMGDGNDGVALEHVKLDGAMISTGTGNDTVTVGGGKTNWVAFNLGVGDDRMNVYGAEFNGVAFVGGTGLDSLALVAVKWNEFPLTTGFELVFGSLMPVANNDQANVDHGKSVTINVLANDRAIVGILDPSTVRITQQPAHGSVTVNDDGTITYTSDTGSTAIRDSFRYTVRSSTGAVSNQATVTIVLPPIPDTTGPTPTITTPGVTDPTNDTPIPFQIQFDENVVNFDQLDVSVTNGTISGFTKVDNKTFTFNVTPTADGAVTVSLAAGAAEDKKGNDSSAATKTITFDTAGATPTISSTEPSPTDANPIPITVTFNEAVTDFTLSDVVVTNGTASNFQGSGTTYTFNIAPTANGTITVNIAAGAANDAAGNPSLAATEFTIVSDTSAPSVTLSTSAGTPTNLAAIPFEAVFSEAVADFVASDITVTNGTVTNFQGSGTTYTFDVTPTADGDVTVSIAAGVAHDSGGNGNTAATPITRVSDRTLPTATVETTEPEPTTNNPMAFSVTFSEPVTGFTAGDILVVNGAVTNFQGSGASYTFDVVPSAGGVQVSVSVPAGVAEDAATNGNQASNTVTRTFNGTTVSTSLTTTSGDPTNDVPIPITVTFGESVTGFDLTDISVTNGTASNLQGSGANYTFDVTPTADGPVVVDVVAGAATGDVSGDPTSAAQLTITSDTTAPGGTITGPASPTNTSPIPFSIAFTETVTGFDLADITVTNGTASNLQGSGANYTFDVTPTADGDVIVSVAAGVATDLAGNDNTAVSAVTVVFDSTAPTALVETTEPDPTTANPIPFTVTFSESVTGFDAGDITVTNGTVTNFSGSGASYSFAVIPSGSGVTVTVSIAAGVAQDGATNGNQASNVVTRQFNGTIVSATLAPVPSDPTNASPIQFTLTFGESVTGFDLTDLTVTNGTASNLQGSGASYTFDVTPTADGLVTVDLATGAATGDVSGGSTAAASASITSDTTAPTVSITAPAGPTNQDPIPITVTFSESVIGFDGTDVVIGNGTISNFQGSGTTYTFDVSPAADGNVTIDIPASVATDAAGNGNVAATQAVVASDRTNPTVAINDSSANAITGTSADASGVTGVEISVFNGTFFWSGSAFDSATEVFFATTSSDNFATWSLTFAPGGPFTVHARATDGAGNVGESTNNNVTVTP
jgi:hypothetical protein